MKATDYCRSMYNVADIYYILSLYCTRPIIIRIATLFADDDIGYTLYNRRMRDTHLSYRYINTKRRYYYDNIIWNTQFNNIYMINDRYMWDCMYLYDMHIIYLGGLYYFEIGSKRVSFSYSKNYTKVVLIDWYVNKSPSVTIQYIMRDESGMSKLVKYRVY